jgi:PAS domain S-box-containing protein
LTVIAKSRGWNRERLKAQTDAEAASNTPRLNAAQGQSMGRDLRAKMPQQRLAKPLATICFTSATQVTRWMTMRSNEGLASSSHRSPNMPPASLGVRLDEAATAIHYVAGARLFVTLAGAVLGALVLTLQQAAVWLTGGLVVEVWSWLATRPVSDGKKNAKAARWNFGASYVAQMLCWLALGIMLISSGTLAGQATGLALIVSLGAIGVLLFYSTPAVFGVAGLLPAAAALSVVALRDGHGWQALAPIWLALVLGAIFTLGRAVETPSAQESNRRLNDSLSQYRVLADNITDIISRTRLDGVNEYMSPASFAVLGYHPEELVGASRWDLAHPDSLPEIRQALRRMMDDPHQPQIITMRIRHKDGHWVWLQTSARLVFENGAPVAVIDVSRDVTERVAIEAALREAKTEAESATRAKAEFLANVSHEIRTPMNGILGALHLLESESISDEGRELMRQADDCGRMLSQLLNDVLDFSKIEAGQLDLAPEPMNVAEALTAVTALLGGQAHAKGVDLRCEITGENLWIDADPVRLRQAMFNLVGNAVKFTSAGFVAVRLAVEAGKAGGRHVRLEVQDTGIGMTADAQAHLFERFHQGDGAAARRFGGTGLGLAITQGLIRRMDGEVHFSSVEGEGSTFWIEFDAPAAQPVTIGMADDGILEGLNILLVDDNPTNRLVARTMLTRLGASIEEAENGLAGLNAARRGAHDLILMDIQMPHMNGVEATRAIRGLTGAVSETPILGLTANVMVHQRAEYMAAGMNGVVAKPISPALLLAEIGRLMVASKEPEAAAPAA